MLYLPWLAAPAALKLAVHTTNVIDWQKLAVWSAPLEGVTNLPIEWTMMLYKTNFQIGLSLAYSKAMTMQQMLPHSMWGVLVDLDKPGAATC